MTASFALAVALAIVAAGPANDPATTTTGFQINRPIRDRDPSPRPAIPKAAATRPQPLTSPAPAAETEDRTKALKDLARSPVVLLSVASLAPVAVLMMTAFVRIQIVLVLLRQALGSPQVPGNQVLTALALMLTALVMRPVGEAVYQRSIRPYVEHRVNESEALASAVRPIKAFMLEQIQRTNHEQYVWAIFDEVTPVGHTVPVYEDDFPFAVVATAFLLSELTTALVIGFYLYLPFLVVDLVVSAVLAAMGLFMLPPSLVALPMKLILFVLVNGWLQVATLLLQSFGPVAASPP